MPARVMGVLNVTPDSFSDGGRWLDLDAAVAHGMAMVAEGAQILDVGGESTRPGAAPVAPDEEQARVLPVISALAPHVRVSVDTTKASVARAAVAAGASMINDVSASLSQVAADTGAAWIAMHMQGDPRTMQADPHYRDVVGEVAQFLLSSATSAVELGVSEVYVDPGIGFGKTVEHNLDLLRNLDVLTKGRFPVVVGTSRKSFLGKLTAGESVPGPLDRLEGSLSTAIWCTLQGVDILRVHDVQATVRALQVIEAVAARPVLKDDSQWNARSISGQSMAPTGVPA